MDLDNCEASPIDDKEQPDSFEMDHQQCTDSQAEENEQPYDLYKEVFGDTDIYDKSLTTTDRANPNKLGKLSTQKCLELLEHASECKDGNCWQPGCQKMKRLVFHTKNCKRKSGTCPICKQVTTLCCVHAEDCREVKCSFLLCTNIRLKNKKDRPQELMEKRQFVMSEPLRELIFFLRCPITPAQQKEIVRLLRDHPLLLNSYLKYKLGKTGQFQGEDEAQSEY